MKLLGHRVVVTGASSGIGREVAVGLAGRGATVVAVGRDRDELSALLSAGPPPGRFELVQADLATQEGREAVLARAGMVDGLVNDAGVGWAGLVADMPPEEMDRMVAVNLLAVMRLTRELLPRIRAQGHVVNVGSVLGMAASPPLTVYAATKFGVHGFSQGLRAEVAGQLYVSEVMPGPVSTRFFRRATERPGSATVPDFPMMDPARVARAVVRVLERPGWPGYRTVGVPRGAAALTHLSSLPGPNLVRRAAAAVARSPLVLRPSRGKG